MYVTHGNFLPVSASKFTIPLTSFWCFNLFTCSILDSTDELKFWADDTTEDAALDAGADDTEFNDAELGADDELEDIALDTTEDAELPTDDVGALDGADEEFENEDDEDEDNTTLAWLEEADDTEELELDDAILDTELVDDSWADWAGARDTFGVSVWFDGVVTGGATGNNSLYVPGHTYQTGSRLFEFWKEIIASRVCVPKYPVGGNCLSRGKCKLSAFCKSTIFLSFNWAIVLVRWLLSSATFGSISTCFLRLESSVVVRSFVEVLSSALFQYFFI